MENSNVTPLVPKEKSKGENNSFVSSLSPREIVSELDRYVVGQNKAKKAVAIALRNRWRRQALKGEMKDEVLPKNILMIGPTGVGKTEISRRLSKLAQAPFVKVEATRFTEVGYVGRDVEQIVRDLLEIAIAMEKVKKRKEVYTQAQTQAEEKVLDALVGNKASVATRESFRKRLRNGDLDSNEIEISVSENNAMPSFEIPGMPGANVGMINISEMLGKSMGKKPKKKKENENLKNVSIPKGLQIENVDLEKAKYLCSLPKIIGKHPDLNEDISINVGRFGPYLKCSNKSARIESVDELFTIGLNRAVTLISEAKPGRMSSSEIKNLGEHPEDKKPVRIMKGQYGPYIKYKSLNATIPENKDPIEITMEEALILIEKRKEYDKSRKKKK